MSTHATSTGVTELQLTRQRSQDGYLLRWRSTRSLSPTYLVRARVFLLLFLVPTTKRTYYSLCGGPPRRKIQMPIPPKTSRPPTMSQGGPTLISNPRRSTWMTRRQAVLNAPNKRMELPMKLPRRPSGANAVDFVKLLGQIGRTHLKQDSANCRGYPSSYFFRFK